MSETPRPDLDQVRDALRRRDERQTEEEEPRPAPAPDTAEDDEGNGADEG